MSLIFATQLTAVATAALVALALAAALVAGLALRKQSRELAILVAENSRQADERRRGQALSVYIGLPPRTRRIVQPAAYNASGIPVFEAQFWYFAPDGIAGYYAQDGLCGPDDLGMIMPGPVGHNGSQMSYDEALGQAILTFRDAEGARWLRMPGGTLKPQTRATAHDSVLVALGHAVPATADPPELTAAAEGAPADLEAPGAP